MDNYADFDGLVFFAKVKKRPEAFFGRRSLLSLRDQLFGMRYAFDVCGKQDALRYFSDFVEHYNRNLFCTSQDGYVCWWNHILYTSGNMDDIAFNAFFSKFEAYLLKEHGLCLPGVE